MKNKIIYNRDGTFSFQSRYLNDPITKFRRKTRFYSINKMIRWFKIRKILAIEINLPPGKYTEEIFLKPGIDFRGILND